MKSMLSLTFVLLVGGLMPIQGSINAQMGQILGHPLRGTLMNFATGGFVLVALLVLWAGFPEVDDLFKAPWYLYTGGIMGVVFVTTMLTFIPELGALRVLAAVVVGQLIVSAIIDNYGWLTVPVHSLSASRVLGMGFLIAGLYFINR